MNAMELPFETYERITEQKWPGGKSSSITAILQKFNVSWPSGSAEANLCLQGILIAMSRLDAVIGEGK